MKLLAFGYKFKKSFMKIYLSKINESWIIDRVRKEWYENNKDISTKFIKKADVIWIISPWLWSKIPKKLT